MAQSLKQHWRPGDQITPWLRSNADKLLSIKHEGRWSWAALAAAMSAAGITYRTGNAWSGETLRLQIRQASKTPKKRASADFRATAAVPPNSDVLKTQGSGSAYAGRAESETATIPTPKFRAFTVKPYKPPPALTPEQATERAALEKRFFGK